MSLLAAEFLGNSVAQWGLAVAAAGLLAVTLALVLRVVRARMTAWVARTRGELDDVVAEVLQTTRGWFIGVVAAIAGAQTLTLPGRAAESLARLVAVAVILQIGLWLNAAIRGWLGRYLAHRRGVDATGATTAAILGFISRVVLWSLVLLMMLDNFGFDVTALVASLGIGGVAVALAVQNILGDIFASLAIALDKPVVIGDFIVVGDILGTVERVGLKTTHLRSLSGELIVLPNSDLLSSRIRNYKRMTERRVVFGFGVTYETSSARLRAIPDMVKGIVGRESLARLDRVHLSSFGASALEFEVVYYVRDPDYNKYMDVQQRINLGLIGALRDASVELAYPTRTIHIATPVGDVQ